MSEQVVIGCAEVLNRRLRTGADRIRWEGIERVATAAAKQ